jgi:hypothetical protein
LHSADNFEKRRDVVLYDAEHFVCINLEIMTGYYITQLHNVLPGNRGILEE